MATYQDKLRLEMELTMQSMEAEKQNLLTEHVKTSLLKGAVASTLGEGAGGEDGC